MTDAEVYGIVGDLNRGSLAELLGLGPEQEHSHYALTLQVHQGYEQCRISADDIIKAWKEEAEEFYRKV